MARRALRQALPQPDPAGSRSRPAESGNSLVAESPGGLPVPVSFSRRPKMLIDFGLRKSALKTHQDWTQVFLAAPTVLGVIDTYGIELIHPMREGRSPQQIGRKGVSNHRWIVGGKLCLLLNQWGPIVGWACATANAADNTFQWLIQQVDGRMIVLSDTGFHAAEGDPSNLKLC